MSSETKSTEMSIEELSRTDAWRSLSPRVQRLLTVALPQRNLLTVVRAANPNLEPMLQQKIVSGLLTDPKVQAVIVLYTLGVAPASTPKLEPAAVEAVTVASAQPVTLDAEIMTKGASN